MLARLEAARTKYRAETTRLDATLGGAAHDDQAVMKYVAASKQARAEYLAAIRAEIAKPIDLGGGLQWRPAAALLGQELMNDGHFDAARTAYLQAILDPWQPDTDAAQCTMLIQTLQALPKDQWAYIQRHQAWCCYRLGTLYERGGDPKKSVALYRNALTLERRPRTLLALALAYELHADFEQARVLLEEASKATHQDNPLIEYNLGYDLEKLWLLTDAHAAYLRALHLGQAAAAKQEPLPAASDPDGFGLVEEPFDPPSWRGELTPVLPLVKEACDRVDSVESAMTPGTRDASQKAYDLFKQACALNAGNLLEKTAGQQPAQIDEAERRLFDQYQSLISQSVVAFPRFLPALVKAGILKVNEDQFDQGLSFFQTALEADREDPSALIYYGQTALKIAEHDLAQLDAATAPAKPATPATPAPKPADPDHPDDATGGNDADTVIGKALTEAQQVAKLKEAAAYLKVLPGLGKRLTNLLDKHAIGFEIRALALFEQVHANSFAAHPDRAADQKLLEEAHLAYLHGRDRGGRTIDLFENTQPDDAAPAPAQSTGAHP